MTADQAFEIAARQWQWWDRHAEPSWKVADYPPIKPIGRDMSATVPEAFEPIKAITLNRSFVGNVIVINSPDFPGWHKEFQH